MPRDFRSGIGLPLKDEHANAFGSLTIFSAQPNTFTPEEIRLLEELAGDLAFGIVTLRSRAARKQAEQEVALLGFALDRVREAAYLVDEHGRFRYANEEPCRILAYTREELLAMDVWDIDADFSEDRWSDHWRDVKAQRSLSFESRHRRRDGRIFPVEISANYFEYGGRAYNLALVRDITERKRAEETLEKERKRMEVILSALNTGLSLINPDMTIAWVNQKIREMFPVGEPVGQVCHAFYESRETICEGCGTLQAFLSGKVVESEQLVPSAGRWYYIISQPIKDTSGRVVNVLEGITDITERKQAEEALLAERQRLFDVLETLPVMIRLFTPDHRVAFANRRSREQFGEPNGRHCYEYCFGRSEPCEFCESYDVLKTGRPHHWELTPGDGTVIAAHDFPFTDVDGSPMILEMDIDITEQRKAEAALKEVNERLEQRVAEQRRRWPKASSTSGPRLPRRKCC